MEEARDSVNCAADAVCDALRYLGDISYAVLPKDMAHAVGDFKKAFWTNVRNLIEKEIGWVDERVAGGDRLREEWREKCRRHNTEDVPPEPVV
ncbi:MAG: hypothetical protein ABR555_18300 [Pyrinomonadaceae bacterium]